MTIDRRSVLALTVCALGTAVLPAQAAEEVRLIPADSAAQAARSGEIVLVDVRTPDEWQATGTAAGAYRLDMRDQSFLDRLAAIRASNPAAEVAFICATGGRSGHVARTLAGRGMSGIAHVPEGMMGSAAGPGWLRRGLPVERR